jgi:hypothetical protein
VCVTSRQPVDSSSANDSLMKSVLCVSVSQQHSENVDIPRQVQTVSLCNGGSLLALESRKSKNELAHPSCKYCGRCAVNVDDNDNDRRHTTHVTSEIGRFFPRWKNSYTDLTPPLLWILHCTDMLLTIGRSWLMAQPADGAVTDE